MLLCLFEAEPAHSIGYKLGFTQNSDRFTWSHSFSGLNYTIDTGREGTDSKIRISANSSFRSTLTKTQNGNRWRDSSSGRWSVNYPLSSKSSVGINGSLSRSSDNFSRAKEPLVNQRVGVTLSYRPFSSGAFKSFSLRQSSSRSFNRTFGQGASGLSYSFNTSVSPKLTDGLTPSFTYSRSGNTSLRGHLNASLRGSLGNRIGSHTNTSLSYNESRSDRDYRRRDDPTRLENRFTRTRNLSGSINFKKDDLTLNNSLGYNESRGTDTASDDTTSSKWGTDRKSTRLSWKSSLTTSLSEKVHMSLSVGYSSSESATLPSKTIVDGKNRRDALDKSESDVDLNASFNFTLNEDHGLTFRGVVGRASKDTPEAEINDRDDFTSRVSLLYNGSYDSFNLNLNLSTGQNHNVRLNSKRSANNKWLRNYSLSAATSYQLFEGFSLRHSYSLTASYHEFDFDERFFNVTTPKSNVSRSWSMNHSVKLPRFGGIGLSGSYNLSINDFGNLFETGEQLVTRDGRRRNFSLNASYSTASWLSFGSGFSQVVSTNWKNIRGIRELDNERVNSSIRMSLNYTPSTDNTLSVSASKGKAKSSRRKNIETSPTSITINYSHRF